MNARTNVRATNWPKRSAAKLNMPRESRKGENVASRRTYEERRKKAVASKMDELLANAQKKFARIHAAERPTLTEIRTRPSLQAIFDGARAAIDGFAFAAIAHAKQSAK